MGKYRIKKVRYRGDDFPKFPWAICDANDSLIGHTKSYLEARQVIEVIEKKETQDKDKA